MKKYITILLFLSIFLVGCNTNTSQSMSFKQASSIFSHTIKDIQKTSSILGFDGFKSTNLDIEIFGENNDFKLKTNIVSSGLANYLEHKRQLDTNIKLYFWDKTEQSEHTISGNISNIIIEDVFYLLLQNSELNLGTGNYQEELIRLIAKNIENKRIKTKFPYKSLKDTTQDIKYILDKISALEMFNLVETASYEGKLAYRVRIMPNILQDINLNTDIHIDSFQGLLIVRSASSVELKIEDLKLINTQTKKSFIVKGSISPQKGALRFQSQNDLEKIIQLSWEKTRKSISISIDSLLNTQEMLGLDLKLYPKGTSYESNMQINGLLNISPLMIYGSDLEKDIKIDINGQYKFKNIENIEIKKPDSYMLGEQLIGDQFSLKTILSN